MIIHFWFLCFTYKSASEDNDLGNGHEWQGGRLLGQSSLIVKVSTEINNINPEFKVA